MASITERELAGIHKELRELNRRLDRLCRASIFSTSTPEVISKEESSSPEVISEKEKEQKQADEILEEFEKSLKLFVKD